MSELFWSGNACCDSGVVAYFGDFKGIAFAGRSRYWEWFACCLDMTPEWPPVFMERLGISVFVFCRETIYDGESEELFATWMRRKAEETWKSGNLCM